MKYIGVSPLKNVVPIVYISSEREEKSSKKAIIIMARQHAGETVSSFVMEGLINELLKYTQ